MTGAGGKSGGHGHKTDEVRGKGKKELAPTKCKKKENNGEMKNLQ